jgi:hypothetical protein
VEGHDETKLSNDEPKLFVLFLHWRLPHWGSHEKGLLDSKPKLFAPFFSSSTPHVQASDTSVKQRESPPTPNTNAIAVAKTNAFVRWRAKLSADVQRQTWTFIRFTEHNKRKEHSKTVACHTK